MALWIRDTSTVPDGGWQYPGINGYTISVRNYSLFYEEIVKHYTANGQTPPTREEVTAYVCANLNVPCQDGQEPFVNRWSQGLPPLGQQRSCCK